MAEVGGERLVLTTPRLSLAFIGLVCAATAVVGVLVIGITDDILMRLWSWLGVGLLTLAAVVAVFKLRKPPQLILTPEGFTLTGLGSPGHIAWSEVEAFTVYQEAANDDGEGGVPAHAAWVLREDASAREGLTARINRGGGMPIDGSLPRNIGMKPEPLAALMEDWRVRYG